MFSAGLACRGLARSNAVVTLAGHGHGVVLDTVAANASRYNTSACFRQRVYRCFSATMVAARQRRHPLRAKSSSSAASVRAWIESGETTRQVQGLPVSDTRIEYRERKLLSYSKEQLFDMVIDIDEYKVFLPYCLKSEVISTKDSGCEAALEIGFASVTESYTSNVKWDRPFAVTAKATDTSLFNELINEWQFVAGPVKNGRPSTYVDIYVAFEFKSAMHSLLARAAFDKVTNQMIAAFEKRASEIYKDSS